MRTHRVAQALGYIAFLDVFGYGAQVNARLRIVRAADKAPAYEPPFWVMERQSVVQWAYETAPWHIHAIARSRAEFR